MVKSLAKHMLHSHRLPVVHMKNCTLMLLSNLQEPDWISVSCNQKLVNTVICKIEDQRDFIAINETKIHAKFHFCKSTTVVINDKCYSFLWDKIGKSHRQFCLDNIFNKHSYFSHIFNAVSSVNTFPTLIFQNNNNVQTVKVHKLFGKVRFIYHIEKNSTVSGIHICVSHKRRNHIGTNIFHCIKGGYILYSNTCDGIQDCPDSSDEQSCICDKDFFFKTKENNICKVQTRQIVNRCTPNYYMEVNGNCKKYDFKMVTNQDVLLDLQPKKGENRFLCNNGKELHVSFINDLVSDCGAQFEDEPILQALKEKNKTFHCNPWEIPCMEGHIKCFNFTDICIYKLNTENHIIPCRNGGHLENCRHFECNMMFKCPDYYCIPWTYVCDGKWDCPFAEDEVGNLVCNVKTMCHDMYKCRNEHQKCISIGNVCDGQIDCPHHDDEMFCELKGLQCPASCSCLIFAITCVSLPYDISQFDLGGSYLAISIFESKIMSIDIFKHKLENINSMQLPGNSITSVCPMLSLRYLFLLDVSDNHIVEVKGKCFSVSQNLKSIHLNNNNIIYLNSFSFHDLYHLRFLNLSNNQFTYLPSKCFSTLLSLKVLNLGNIIFEGIDANSFFSTNVKLISTLDYKISCVSPDNCYCTSYPPWYKACSHILPSASMKAIYITISILIIYLNIMCILMQILKSQNKNINKNFQIKVIGLNFSDILCGIYLSAIWVSDMRLKGIYLINEDLWKSHPLCFISLCVVLWFTVSSQTMILYLSASRLIAVIDPFKTRLISGREIFFHVTTINSFSFCIILVATLALKFNEKQLPTSLCSPFIDPLHSSISTNVITWVVIITQSVSSVLIFLMHILLVNEVTKSKRSLKIQKSEVENKMMYQLILTSTTNILCWIPANIIYISAMFLSIYPINLVIWATVVVMPINSIINPLVFILTNLKMYFQKLVI